MRVSLFIELSFLANTAFFHFLSFSSVRVNCTKTEIHLFLKFLLIGVVVRGKKKASRAETPLVQKY